MELKAEELSMAGSPEKMLQIYRAMLKEMEKVDGTNAAELVNLQYLLQRLMEENNRLIRLYENKTGQQIRP